MLINTFQVLEPAALAALNGGEQPDRSVVYVSFGSQTAMSTELMKELGSGRERSGCRFLWVVKSKRVKERGLVVKQWVEQEKISKYRAVGGFVSHCGWNSVTEAALHGVNVLAWPTLGDQRVYATIPAWSGLGMWVEKRSWETEEVAVKGDEICERVRETMRDQVLSALAARMREVAVAAVGDGGSSYEALTQFIDRMKKV
ncbi:unnamed protein product [Musa acuminata subsp. malaccensis]|uniref:(wild Malaysian banana) hypothetical protein n=1 Tax=Musa acuminata subsp. malaccensis TaxID=214687 RepID=A0A804KQX4_MUSAM|nr:unnamed protein product [Musa acuminata subsp. malaccensis]